MNNRTGMCLIRMLHGPSEPSGFPDLLPGNSESAGPGCSRSLTTTPEFSRSRRPGKRCRRLHTPVRILSDYRLAHFQSYWISLPCSLKDCSTESPHQHYMKDSFFHIFNTFYFQTLNFSTKVMGRKWYFVFSYISLVSTDDDTC